MSLISTGSISLDSTFKQWFKIYFNSDNKLIVIVIVVFTLLKGLVACCHSFCFIFSFFVHYMDAN